MKTIRVGTDCSGIEAPIQALKNLGIPFKHVFSSDIDPYCRQSIIANYDPAILYEDMTNRNIVQIPEIDLYVCGFPCQSFSTAGKRKGMKEKRGQIFWHCVDVIEAKQPSVFILENVKGLLTINNGKTFDKIIKTLKEIGNGLYTLSFDILDTKDFGVPQHRERLFIVGTKKGSISPNLSQLKKKKMKKISSFIDYSDTDTQEIPPYINRSNLLKRIPENAVFIDIGFTQNNFPNSDLYSPSVTTGGNLWCVPMQRHATIKELLSLQKFPTKGAKRFKQVVSNTQMKKQIGNSMSVCVLESIFEKLYYQSLSNCTCKNSIESIASGN
jgi:DNA (cytosine-5)-methyltransferase 1